MLRIMLLCCVVSFSAVTVRFDKPFVQAMERATTQQAFVLFAGYIAGRDVVVLRQLKADEKSWPIQFVDLKTGRVFAEFNTDAPVVPGELIVVGARII